MCYITATEFKNHLGHYMELSFTEDVYVTKNNKVITVLTNPERIAMYSFEKMFGALAPYDEGQSYEDLIGEAILERNGYKNKRWIF